MYLIKTSAIWGLGEIFLFLFLGQDSRALTEYRVTHMYIVNEGSSLLKIEVFH